MNIKIKKHDRICFLGDSITANGTWMAEVVEYFLKNMRELEVEFYNCGISGSQGRLASIKNRLYCDFLNYFPGYVVIMFGANDVARYLYEPKLETPERKALRESRLAEYEGAISELADICVSRDITPIICTPTPYDEFNDPPTERWNVDAALSVCADTARRIAENNGFLLADMRSVMLEHMDKRPISTDRLHPTEYGYHLMAEKFLCTIGAKASVEPDVKCVFSKENLHRREIETVLRDIIFVDRDYMGWQYEERSYSLQYRKTLLRRRLERESRDFSRVYNNYVRYADIKDELQGELLKRTFEMYK